MDINAAIESDILSLQTHFDPRTLKKLETRLVRICFKLAPLNETTGNTQTINRWEVKKESPHYSAFEDCLEVFSQLVKDLIDIIENKLPKDREILDVFRSKEVFSLDLLISELNSSSRIGSSELPVWYKE